MHRGRIQIRVDARRDDRHRTAAPASIARSRNQSLPQTTASQRRTVAAKSPPTLGAIELAARSTNRGRRSHRRNRRSAAARCCGDNRRCQPGNNCRCRTTASAWPRSAPIQNRPYQVVGRRRVSSVCPPRANSSRNAQAITAANVIGRIDERDDVHVRSSLTWTANRINPDGGGPCARAISRSASAFLCTSRLSCICLPRATAISTLARPSLKYRRSGTSVNPLRRFAGKFLNLALVEQ